VSFAAILVSDFVCVCVVVCSFSCDFGVIFLLFFAAL
jgi:hypothetical protein